MGGREAVRQSEEAFLLLLASFKACLDELDKDPVGARMARLSQRLDATGSAWGEAHALADGFLYGCHGSRIHAPWRTREVVAARAGSSRRGSPGAGLLSGSARDVGSGARAKPLLLLDTRDLFGQLFNAEVRQEGRSLLRVVSRAGIVLSQETDRVDPAECVSESAKASLAKLTVIGNQLFHQTPPWSSPGREPRSGGG